MGKHAVRVRYVAAMFTLALVSFAIYGWLSGQLALAGGSNRLMAMSPVTAAVFVLLSASILLAGPRSAHRRGFIGAAIAIQLVAGLMVLSILVDHALGARISIERLLSADGFIGSLRAGFMPTYTAAALLVVQTAMAIGWSLLLRGGEHEKGIAGGVAAFLAGATLLFAVLVITGYIYDSPLFDDGVLNPPGLPASLALATLSIGALALILPFSRSLSFLAGPKMSAQLVRSFVPAVMLVIIFDSLMDRYAGPLFSENPTLWRTTESLVGAVIVVVVIMFVSRRMGGIIDSAKAEAAAATSTLFTRSEELKTSFDNAPVGLIVTDLDGVIVETNPMLGRMLGYRHGAPVLVSKRAIELFHPDDLAAVAALIENAKLNGLGTHLAEHRVVRHDGGSIWVHMSISAAHGPQGDPVSLLFSLQDVTPLKDAQEIIEDRDHQILRSYADIIQAMTGDRLMICTAEKLKESLGERVLNGIELNDYSELGGMRQTLRTAVTQYFPRFTEMGDLILAVGEGSANMIKHGSGGIVALHSGHDSVQVLLEDFGPGIDFSLLPKATLKLGFSTKSSLGAGFTIMLATCDRTVLSTEPGRTLLLLEKSIDGRDGSESGILQAEGIQPLDRSGDTVV